MAESKHRKNHKKKLADYKAKAKREQDAFKKKMIDHYTKMQQESIANQESHTSTQDVSGPEINIEELNMIDDLNPIINIDNLNENIESNDNNN